MRRAVAEATMKPPKRSGHRPHRKHRALRTGSSPNLPEIIDESNLSVLNPALGFLFGRLREARALFEQKGDNGRLAAMIALSAFWQFITLFRTPLAENLHIPIVRLRDALAMLEHNKIEPILRPVPRRGRARSSHSYAAIKGYATATVELLRQAGLDPQGAHRAVARVLRQVGIRPERGRDPVTGTTVKNWCDEIAEDYGRRGTAALTHDLFLGDEQERFSALPKDKAKGFALRLLAASVGSIFPNLQKPT
jgi:hypothetical protein